MQTLKIKQRIIQKHEKKKYSTKLYVASVISKTLKVMAGLISAGGLQLRGDYALMQPAVIVWTE